MHLTWRPCLCPLQTEQQEGNCGNCMNSFKEMVTSAHSKYCYYHCINLCCRKQTKHSSACRAANIKHSLAARREGVGGEVKVKPLSVSAGQCQHHHIILERPVPELLPSSLSQYAISLFLNSLEHIITRASPQPGIVVLGLLWWELHGITCCHLSSQKQTLKHSLWDPCSLDFPLPDSLIGMQQSSSSPRSLPVTGSRISLNRWCQKHGGPFSDSFYPWPSWLFNTLFNHYALCALHIAS